MLVLNKTSVVLPTRPARASCVTVKVVATSTKKGVRAEFVAATGAVLGLASAAPALAVESEPVDSAIDNVISVVKASGDFIKSGISTVQAGVQVLKDGYDVAAPVVGQAVKAAAPVVEQVVKVTSDVASPVIRSALPQLQDQATNLLESTGLSTSKVAEAGSVVQSTASNAATTVTPFVSKFLQFVTTSDPLTLGEYALGALALVYLTPGLLGLVGGSFRGFAGELAPAAALDLLVNEGNVALVDIRTSKEKEGSGIPDLPSSASGKALEVEYAVTEDKRLRGQLRDPSAIEAQVTALQIASLKRIGNGTKVVLLDRYGPAARTVAKELARKGYGRVYVIQGGFDGRGGWVQSKLQIKPAAILTSSAPPSIARTVFTRGSKQLPAPKSS